MYINDLPRCTMTHNHNYVKSLRCNMAIPAVCLWIQRQVGSGGPAVQKMGIPAPPHPSALEGEFPQNYFNFSGENDE